MSSVLGAPVLEVQDLAVTFDRKGEQPTKAVDGVSFTVAPGETVGLVGESGCGKSVTSLAIMGLLPQRGVSVSGSVRLEGQELIGSSDKTLRKLRGARHGDGLPGPAVLAEPDGADRHAGHRGAARAP